MLILTTQMHAAIAGGHFLKQCSFLNVCIWKKTASLGVIIMSIHLNVAFTVAYSAQ